MRDWIKGCFRLVRLRIGIVKGRERGSGKGIGIVKELGMEVGMDRGVGRSVCSGRGLKRNVSQGDGREIGNGKASRREDVSGMGHGRWSVYGRWQRRCTLILGKTHDPGGWSEHF